jgi:hypothetical protein
MRQRFLVGEDRVPKKETLMGEEKFQAFRFEQLVNFMCKNNYKILGLTWFLATGALAVVITSTRGMNLPIISNVALYLIYNVLTVWAYRDGGRHMKTVQFIVQFIVGITPMIPCAYLAYETSQSGGNGLDIAPTEIMIIAIFPIFGSLFARMSTRAVFATRLPQVVILSFVLLLSPTEDKPAGQLQVLTAVVFVWSMLLTLVYFLEAVERKLYHSQQLSKMENTSTPVYYDATPLYLSTAKNNPCSPRCWPEYPAPGSPPVAECATFESKDQPHQRAQAKANTTLLFKQETPLTGSYNSFGEGEVSLTERNIKLHNKLHKQEQKALQSRDPVIPDEYIHTRQKEKDIVLHDTPSAKPKWSPQDDSMCFEMET